jgi:hypothetical protein
MSTFTFASANGATIPADTEIVLTSGHTKVGIGAALYVADPSVTAPSDTTFTASDGRKFRLSLDQTITPFMFGAMGVTGFHADATDFTTIPDDTVALQAFFDFCKNRSESVNWGGVFGITAPLAVGDIESATQEDYEITTRFDGELVLAVKSPIKGAVVTVRNRRHSIYDTINIIGPNKQSRDWSKRNYDIGVLVERQAQMQTFGTIFTRHARVAGCIINGRGELRQGDNTFHARILNGHFSLCGSGSGPYLAAEGQTEPPAESFLAATFGAHARINPETGAADTTLAGNPGQITRIGGVSAFPPLDVITAYNLTVYVRIAGNFHQVVRFDPSNSFIDVTRWVDTAVPQESSLQYVFGGGPIPVGGDAGMMDAKVSSIGCGIGVQNIATYGGDFHLTSQGCALGMVYGKGFASAHLGGLARIYSEGNLKDFLYNATSSDRGHFMLLGEQAIDLGKVEYMRPRRVDNTFVEHLKPTHLLMNIHGKWHSHEFSPDVDGGLYTLFWGFDAPFGEVIPLRGDNADIRMVDVGPDFKRLFGYRARLASWVGSGRSRAPTGNLTVRPASAAHRINGGAAGEKAVFTGPWTSGVLVQVEQDPADPINVLVSFLSGLAEPSAPYLRATMQNPTLGAGVQQTIPATTFTKLALQRIEDTANAFDEMTRIYKIPQAGTYSCTLKVRPVDSTADSETSYGVGVDTLERDSVSFVWGETFRRRQGLQNQVTRTFSAGEEVRAFIYSDVELNLNGAELVISKIS